MQSFYDWVEGRWKTGKLFWDIGQAVVAALSFGVPAWAASASAWLDQWGPVAWVAAGFCGLLSLSVSLWVVAKMRDSWISSSIKRRFYEGGDRINPLETVFSHRRINIADLLPPLSLYVDDKTFINCDLVGPAQILLERSSMTNTGGESIDAILGRPGAFSANGIFFRNCVFRDCRFYRITFLVAEYDYQMFIANNPNVGFITHVPTGQGLLPTAITPQEQAPQKPNEIAGAG